MISLHTPVFGLFLISTDKFELDLYVELKYPKRVFRPALTILHIHPFRVIIPVIFYAQSFP